MGPLLVTGSAGFIGHKVSQFLLEKGYQVVGIDNLNDYYDVKLKKFRLETLTGFPHFSFFEMDVENNDDLTQLFSDHTFEKVFHLAAQGGVRNSIDNPRKYVSTNVLGTLNMLEQCKNHKIRNFVTASTSSLYTGHQPPFHETLNVNKPNSPYAATKGAAELLCHSYHHLYSLNITILRYFTVYGPLSRPDMAQFRFLHKMSNDQPIQINGDGTQGRDFTYIDDIAVGTMLAGDQMGFHTFNLGRGGKPIQLNTMIEMFEEALNKKAKKQYFDFNGADIFETFASNEKAVEVLGWKPQVSFEKGLQKCIEDYRLHQEFFDSISI